MTQSKSPAKKIRSYKRLIRFLASKSKSTESLAICPQTEVSIAPSFLSNSLSYSTILQINIPPKKNFLQYSKPVLAEFPPTMFKQHEYVEPNLPDVRSQLESMQNLVIQIQLDFKEQIKLKDEEVDLYRTALLALGMPRRLPPPSHLSI